MAALQAFFFYSIFFQLSRSIALRRTQFNIPCSLFIGSSVQYLNTFPPTITSCVLASKVAFCPECEAAVVMMQATE
jgi:hypothetical protein